MEFKDIEPCFKRAIIAMTQNTEYKQEKEDKN